MGLLWPVPGHYTISSGFNDTRSYGLHAGIDIPAPAVPTIAVGDGTVIYKGWAGSAGRSVYLQLDTGWRVHYCHLDTFLVNQGQVVSTGDVIGYVGGSGYEIDNYWGSHLHLNLFKPEPPGHYVSWVGMWAVDPELYLGVEEDDMTDAQLQAILSKIQESMNFTQAAHDVTRKYLADHIHAGKVETMTKVQESMNHTEAAAQVTRANAQEQATRVIEAMPQTLGGGLTHDETVQAVKDAQREGTG